MLERIGISLERSLLEQFDQLIERKGYVNRSEAVRDLIREQLVQREWSESDGGEKVAVVAIVYDHESSSLAQKLTHIQHENHRAVVSALHVHMDAHNCLEVLVLRGRAADIVHMAEGLVSTRGVKYGRVVPATTGETLRLRRGTSAATASRPGGRMASVTRCELPELGRRIEGSVWDAGRRARAEVHEAEAEARRLRDEAEADRARLRHEATAAGLAEGLARAAATLAGAAAARDRILAGAAHEVAALAVEVARRILSRELERAPTAVVAIAERAIATARTRRQVTVRVAPADLPRVAAEEGRLASVLERGALALREDPALAPGDVVVETEAGRVDARIEAQLAAFAQALEDATP